MSTPTELPLNSKVLCCFADQETARPYESALVNRGVSLLRARNSMHAIWLANSSVPPLAIVDVRSTESDLDLLLTRLQGTKKLSSLRVLVITDEELPESLTGQFVAISGKITPADLAARVWTTLADLDKANAENVDEFFSMLGEVSEDDFRIDESTFIRTDDAGKTISTRSTQDTRRPSRLRSSN